METLASVKNALSTHKEKLFVDYPLKSLAIFGSYSREEQDPLSDLDILVEFSDKIGIRFIDLADDLEKIVGLKVDLVSKRGVKPKYLASITPDLIYV